MDQTATRFTNEAHTNFFFFLLLYKQRLNFNLIAAKVYFIYLFVWLVVVQTVAIITGTQSWKCHLIFFFFHSALYRLLLVVLRSFCCFIKYVHFFFRVPSSFHEYKHRKTTAHFGVEIKLLLMLSNFSNDYAIYLFI